jgi:mRNA interferase RelE/StbE
MNFLYSRKCLKYLQKLDREAARKIVQQIEKLPAEGDVKKLKGEKDLGLYRLRIGKFRAVYRVESDRIRILVIDTRGDVSKKVR